MPTSRPHATRRTAAAVSAATLLLLTGCGGGDAPKASGSSAPPSPSGTPSALPTATAPGDVKTTTTTTALPVPSGGPTEVHNFPVPEGVRIKGPGPDDRAWQFDIRTGDTAGVLAFYRKALAQRGYTVRNDVRETIGIEKVKYDIAFSGPADGYIVADPSADDVFVVVQSLPDD